MNSKNAITAGLLAFVAVAVVTAIVKSSSNSDTSDASSVPTATSTSAANPKRPGDGVVATFFHGEMRCPTCRNIENYANSAIKNAFADELSAGKLHWRTINYETPENKHYATDYEIFSSTIVLTRNENGEVTEWRNLDRVWELVFEEEAFKQYIAKQTEAMLNQLKESDFTSEAIDE